MCFDLFLISSVMASGPRPCATTPGSGALEPASRAQPGAPASDTDPGRQAARRGGGSHAERAARPRNAASARPRPPRVEQQRRPAAAQGRGDHALERAPPTCGTSRGARSRLGGDPGRPTGRARATRGCGRSASSRSAGAPVPGAVGPDPGACLLQQCAGVAYTHVPCAIGQSQDLRSATSRAGGRPPRSPKPGAVAEARRTWARTRVKCSARRARAAVGRSLLRRLPRSLT